MVKILFLWSAKNSWTQVDWAERTEEHIPLLDALQARGYVVAEEMVAGNVARALDGKGYDPAEWLVVNWCDGFTDRPSGYIETLEEIEALGLNHLGSGSATLRTVADKRQVRARLREKGLRIPEGSVVETLQDLAWRKFPAIVKPSNQHASIGITNDSVVQNEAALARQVAFVLDVFHAPALVEEFIPGREFTVTVCGNANLELLPPLELDYGMFGARLHHIYSYEAKFISDVPEVDFRYPVTLDARVMAELNELAVGAFRALACRDYARIDVRLGGGEPYLLDVNANPDINAESAVGVSAAAAGIEYGDLLVKFLQAAQERRATCDAVV
ncbi:MAG: hypothetical protein HY741_21635 [Chloroflexi bacterium]|nr:hypothetical protein [Chloroflexota bacterium]